MKLQLAHCLLALGLVVSSAISAQAQAPASSQVLPSSSQVLSSSEVLRTSQLLPGGSLCNHVIHLIHCHGVNNSVDLAASHTMLHHSPLGSMLVPGVELGDLEICHVAQLLPGDPGCGPKISVTVKNHGCRKVCNFHITAVAILGRICPTSPNHTVCVEHLGPGEALEVIVPLPIEALAMGNRNGQIIGFQRLVVAIDSYDEFVETNEANNLRAFDVAALPVLTPTVTETVEETVEETVSTTTDSGPVQETVTEEVGGTATAPAPPPADALQTAIRKLGVHNTAPVEATPAS